ncbi:MAG: RHS repeat-associated core domain-containing protein [Paracoccaceae bacterium]
MQASYRYNALGQQVTRTLASGQVIDNLFDMEGHRVAEMDRASGTVIRVYIWLGDMPIAVVEGGQVYLVRVDHIGRSVFATTLAGTVVWSASYLPFGGVHVSTGTPMALRFPGQWFQMESGLHQNWMRDYDPTTGRYIEADPLGLVDGASVYGYARQSPLRWIDPTGLRILILQYGGFLFDRDWYPDPTLPSSIGTRWNHRCSSAQLVFHLPTLGDPNAHWHYYPQGEKSGGRRGRLSRWKDSEGADHFYPPYLLDVPDCPCDGTEVNPLAVIGFALLGASMLTGVGEVGLIGAGVVGAAQ